MHIILTHEQADFDALASLLGAYLLNDSAIPVLPRRMNRNVQAFLTLYGADLPFIDPRDLQSETVETVTLVDTQSMVSIRGMSASTRVSVIDHHPMRENLPPEWKILHEDTGATTTPLVEALRERDGMFTPIQATLLLLGIYEDTGSLTYTRTTARDLRAGAYLLDQGANLRIATNFLNHPLSMVQQAIYDSLRNNAEYHRIHGHTIVVASGEALDTDEELSTIAHKLRDLLDPDALFVLVTTRSGVQVIARSTSDNIDVAEVVVHFGGGGHERAAAGLIRGSDLQSVHQELLDLLAKYVKPAITVAQIMSHGPQVLAPWTPAEEAWQRMRRFGYEGYPVVQDNKVIGLLTRRAVDRVITHKLPRTAASLMDAGEFTVRPDDSVEHLQRLMADSGWGQIPVVNPASGEIIGIVTRTDLLKTLAPEPLVPGYQNLASMLDSTLPSEYLSLLKTISQVAHDQHTALYIVGGFVRDLLLNRPVLDFDLTVEGEAIKLAHALAEQFGGRVTSHARFGTAKWLLQGASFGDGLPASKLAAAALQSIDLVSARTEFYTYPSALPTVERGSIKLDLHRRDFTMNTLALRLDGHHYGELYDYWGGMSDLRHGIVRVLHSLSFVDDPTRMLRAVRFEKRFNFRIEDRTLQLLQEAITLMDRVSGDRIRHELNTILAESNAAQILTRLNELQLLKAIHPNLGWDEWHSQHLKTLPDSEPNPDWGIDGPLLPVEQKRSLAYAVWLMRLPVEQAAQVCGRLKVSVELRNVLIEACNLWCDLPSLVTQPPSQIYDRLVDVPSLSRYAVYLASDEPQLRNVLEAYSTRWQKISTSIDGHELRKRGLPPSPVYKEILSGLRNAWLDGQVATPEEEQKLLEILIGETQK
jgi:tRNA nucleotidyltransferase (CCA-adding enzyme)